MSRCPPGATRTIAAPVTSGQHSSQTETSKPNGVLCATRSAGLSANASCIQRNRFAIASWETPTPLGAPVEPEV